MKVLLLQPPIEDFYDTSIRTYPLSLLYLGSRLKDICDVTVLDLRTNRRRTPLVTHPFPDLTTYYREQIHTPFSFFGKYYRFGSSNEEIREEIEKAGPDVVCISSLFTTYVLEALNVARIAKEVNPEVITVMGGIHPTVFPDHVLAFQWIDFVIRGEGETPLFRLISLLISGGSLKDASIDGLCHREGDNYHISEPYIEQDIDAAPDRSLVHAEAYRLGKKKYTFFLTSRGCPFRCAFCGRPNIPYRRRSLDSIEREIEDCLKLSIDAVDFEDDMLNLDPRFFGEVLELFRGAGLTLSAMNGIYTENLDVATLSRMYDSGFRRLNFSLVDISRSVTDRQGRLFPSNLLTLLPYLENSPYLTEVHYIIGLPDQTPEEVLETMIFLMGRRILPGPSIFYLAPGSPIFAEIPDREWEGHMRSMRSSAMLPINPLMPREILFTLMKIVRFINFVKASVDREPGLTKLSDLLALPAIEGNPITREIVTALLGEERFICYDLKTKGFHEEPQDKALVRSFFKKARGLPIKGFKSMNLLVID